MSEIFISSPFVLLDFACIVLDTLERFTLSKKNFTIINEET